MILCFDIGGSRIKAAMGEGESLTPLGDCPTPLQDFAQFLDVLRGFTQGRNPQGVAIAIAGVVSPETGKIKVANIPCADGRALAEEVSIALNLPCLVINDADSFALAEATFGAGRGERVVFGAILGTGVGGGLVVDGRLVTGAGGYAGEWGHGPILRAPFDFPCGCGQRGCIDAACGARGMERLHRHLQGADWPSTQIVADWRAGGATGAATVALWSDLLAPALALVVNTVGASCIPVGGGLASEAALVTLLDHKLRSMILRSTDAPLIRPALCQPEPGLLGALVAGQAAFAPKP